MTRLMTVTLNYVFTVTMVLLFGGMPSFAASLDHVSMPDTLLLESKELVLNGLGTRQATVFKVNVYVVGLYLEHRSMQDEE